VASPSSSEHSLGAREQLVGLKKDLERICDAVKKLPIGYAVSEQTVRFFEFGIALISTNIVEVFLKKSFI
jgi:hypothetical protein